MKTKVNRWSYQKTEKLNTIDTIARIERNLKNNKWTARECIVHIENVQDGRNIWGYISSLSDDKDYVYIRAFGEFTSISGEHSGMPVDKVCFLI